MNGTPNGNMGSPTTKSKMRSSNLSQGHFMFGEDASKMNLVRNSTGILEKLESLQAQTLQQEKQIDEQNLTIRRLRERMESLLEEKSNLEGLLNQIDEAENHAEFEEYKVKIEQQYKDELKTSTDQMSLRIAELEHVVMQKEMRTEEERKKSQKLEETLEQKKKQIENFQENYVSKVKYEESLAVLKDTKLKFSGLENTMTFKNLKINELEGKMRQLEEKSRKELESARKKGEERMEDAKKKWDSTKEKLKKEVAELRHWKSENLTGAEVDPEQVQKINLELAEYKQKEKDSISQMNKITERFEKMEIQRDAELAHLREQLEGKKKENARLERSLFEERRSNKLLMSETQSISRRSMSRVSSTAEINAQEYIQNFLKLEEENRVLKAENSLLGEELVYVKGLYRDEQELVFASVLGYVVNQRALD